MDTFNEGVQAKATDKSKHMKEILEKTFPSAVARSNVQYERVLLKRNAITNIRVWNNTTKTVLHDGWVLLNEKGIYKCVDQKCETVTDAVVDYKEVDDKCFVK